MVLRQWPKEQYNDLNGNLYTATIHCLVSGITKVSRVTQIPEGLLLYRGFGGLKLPKQFYVAPESGYKGFVEWGFISTTSDKAIAIQYTGIAKGRPFPTVIQVRPAAVDHGGDIGDFSQFPGEREYLWNPCSLLEASGEPFMEITQHGIVQIIPVRMNNNVKTMTVEQLREQKKVMHICGFEFLVNEVKIELARVTEERNAQDRAELVKHSDSGRENILSWIVEGIVEECDKVLEKQRQMPAERFLDDEEYRKVVIEMLETKSHALSKVNLCTEALKQMGGDGSTPLMLAAEKGDVKRVKELIEQKQDLMSRNKLQRTALHSAICPQNLDFQASAQVVEALLHHKADVTAKDSSGKTPLHLVVMNDNFLALQTLLKYLSGKLDEVDNLGRTALHLAACEGRIDIIRALIDASADANAMDFEGKSAIEVAENHGECQHFLKTLGADGWTPLMIAAETGIEKVQNYFRCHDLLHCLKEQKDFPVWFISKAMQAARSRVAVWTWGIYDKAGISISTNKLKLDRLESKTITDYSAAIGSHAFDIGLIHKWSIKIHGSGVSWLGIARGAEEGKGLASAPGTAGRYMLVFPSDGSDQIFIGQKPIFDSDTKFKFLSDQVLDFELDTCNGILLVFVDGKRVCNVRNVDCASVHPYACLSGHVSVTLLSKTFVSGSAVSLDAIDAEESVAFSNNRWTFEMDEALARLPISGFKFYLNSSIN